jgi:Holliday junction resolvase RusA-like endonuclease
MPTKRRCDVVNMLEATLDILVKYGVLADDNSNIVVSMDGSRVLYDKENSRTEVEITPIEC